jgi:hypothetical protein
MANAPTSAPFRLNSQLAFQLFKYTVYCLLATHYPACHYDKEIQSEIAGSIACE